MKFINLLIAAFILACSRPSADAGGHGSMTTVAASSAHPATVRGGMTGGGMMGGRAGSVPMMAAAAAADTSAAPKPKATTVGATTDCSPVSQALVDGGRAVFSGAGNCFACHGSNAKGTALAPDLTDARWLDIDGSYAAISGIVRSGVPNPRQHPAPMPAMGGATLSKSQVCAVAAYVFSLSHSS